MTRVLSHTDYGSKHPATGKPSIKVKGWFIDHRGRRHEETRYISRFVDDSVVVEEKDRIRRVLLGMSIHWKQRSA